MFRRPIIFALLSLSLVACAQTAAPAFVLQTSREKIPLTVEVVDTEPAREKGLMMRTSLAPNTGMWFVFDEEKPLTFWMKNTLIPLDILFFDGQKHVVAIVEDMVPCTVPDPQCARYPSQKPARYALELPAGFVKMHDVKVGDAIE